MWSRLLEWLIGCSRCAERAARVAALEGQLKDALDRLMSRDYSGFAFVKKQLEETPIERTAPRLVSPDGLD